MKGSFIGAILLVFLGAAVAYFSLLEGSAPAAEPDYLTEPWSTLTCDPAHLQEVLVVYEESDEAALQKADQLVAGGACVYNEQRLLFWNKDWKDSVPEEMKPFVEVECQPLKNGTCVAVQPVVYSLEDGTQVGTYMLVSHSGPGYVKPSPAVTKAVKGLML